MLLALVRWTLASVFLRRAVTLAGSVSALASTSYPNTMERKSPTNGPDGIALLFETL